MQSVSAVLVRALIGASLGLSIVTPALAGAAEQAKIFDFCVNAGAPSDEVDKATVITSGAMRREMSGGELMREAWIALKASQSQSGEMASKLRNRAVQYFLICEAHDPGAWQEIANNNNEMLNLLDAWTPSFSADGKN